MTPHIILFMMDALPHFIDLPEQALIHATKGRGILLLPGGHVTSHDPPPEAVHHLALAHCVVGQVFTIQGKYPCSVLMCGRD